MKVLDSYALIELINNNNKFQHLLDDEFIITSFTLAEFWGVLYKNSGKEVADYWFIKFLPFIKEIGINLLKEVYKYRIDNKGINLSLADCIGYMYAVSNKLKFVTGDKDFKNMTGVEFITK